MRVASMNSIVRVVFAHMLWRCFGVAVVLVVLAVVASGCGNIPFPSALTPQSCPGNPCGPMACPSGFVCSVNAQCAPHCDPQPLGNRPF
jgi:hypothetical protein